MARARLRLGFLPQQRTTFTAKDPVNIVAGPYSIAQLEVFSAGATKVGTFMAGVTKTETFVAGVVKGEVK